MTEAASRSKADHQSHTGKLCKWQAGKRADSSDFECFTILRQTDVTGLQVQNRRGDCKLDFPHSENKLIPQG